MCMTYEMIFNFFMEDSIVPCHENIPIYSEKTCKYFILNCTNIIKSVKKGM